MPGSRLINEINEINEINADRRKLARTARFPDDD